MDILPFRVESEKAAVEHKNLDYNIIYNHYTWKEIAAVCTRNRTTFTCWQAKEEELTRYKEEHCIEVRWLPDSDAYRAAQMLLIERSYR